MNTSADVNGKAPMPAAGAPSTAHMPTKVQPPTRGDLQPSYAAQIESDDGPEPNGWYGNMVNLLGTVIGTAGAIPVCFCCPNPYKEVLQGQVGLVQKFGRLTRAVDPGLTRINPLSENLTQISVQIQIVEVPRQSVMTKDNVSIQLSSVIYYRVTAPHIAAFGISDLRQALTERTSTTLRSAVGARPLQDVIERREELAQSIREIIEETARAWGTEVESMLIKDLLFSTELQESLSLAAQSRRAGEAKVITARAEVESAKLMRKAADILASPAAMQIRYLESMQSMAKTANSKVVFLPGPSQNPAIQNPTVQDHLHQAGESPYQQRSDSPDLEPSSEFAAAASGSGFQTAVNARMIENM